MNRNKLSILLFILTFFTFAITSCKKELADVGTKKNKDLKITPLDFEYLNTKSKIRFQNDDKDISVTATIRIKKDSLIWLSLSPAFGIEAARALVTQDSLKIVNRLEREYMVYDFKSLSEKFNFDINFELIQSMLLGEMPIPKSLEDQVSKKDGHFVIHQERENLTADNYIAANKMRPERIQLSENSTENNLSLIYDNFQPLSTFLIPYSNKIILNYKKGEARHTTLIDIDHGKAEIADASLKFPFNIPQKYDQK